MYSDHLTRAAQILPNFMRPFGMSRDAQRKEILKRQAKELMAFDARLLQEEGELETGSKERAKWHGRLMKETIE